MCYIFYNYLYVNWYHVHVYCIVSCIVVGKVGGWRDTFTVAQNEKFDRIWADRMKESTLKFRYTL